MNDVRKTVVRIGGRDYMMRGFESEEYIHEVAIYVDKKVSEVSKSQPTLSTSMIMVLTAINLADEVIKFKDQIQKLELQAAEMKATISKMTVPALVKPRKIRSSK